VAQGVILTEWCDSQGGYLSYSTNFDIYPRSPVVSTTVAPPTTSITPAATGINKCKNTGRVSGCQILGPSYVTVPAGQNYTFAVTLECPVESCHSRWVATFGACGVTVHYDNVNPIYTIKAPIGSEGRGGYVVTEWCDDTNGYMNWTTNFVVTGVTSNATYRAAAEVGVMMSGQTDAAASTSDPGSNPWKHTGWIIACFVLLAFFGSLFLLAVARLLFCRSKPYVSGGRGEPGPQSTDFNSTPTENANPDVTMMHHDAV